MSRLTREDIGRLAYALPLAVGQDDEAAADALLEGLDLIELQALCTGVASLVVQSLEVLCESAGEPDPKATAMELLRKRALQAATE